MEDFNIIFDVSNATKMMKRNRGYMFNPHQFNGYVPCHVFSVEDLNFYLCLSNLKGKNILTLCEADHILMSILSGAKRIDSFSNNRLSYYDFILKYYAVKYLSYEEFMHFYNLSNNFFPRMRVYRKIVEGMLESNVRVDEIDFWNSIFISNEYSFSSFYRYEEPREDISSIMRRIPYLNKDVYSKLKGAVKRYNLNNFRFVPTDLRNVSNVYKDSYDMINFSDIIKSKNINKTQNLRMINEIVSNNLADDGRVYINLFGQPFYCGKTDSYINDALQSKVLTK